MAKKELTRQEREQKASKSMRIRMLLMLIFFGVLAFIPLVYQLYTLQIVRHDELEQKAISQQVRGTVVEAGRGVIYDRNGKTMAASASVETIYLAPVYIKDEEQARTIARGLSEILELDFDDVYAKTANRNSYYQRVQRKVEKEVADRVREFKSQGNYTAIQIEPDTKRYYPFGSTASQVIGFVNVDGEGLGGIELQYDRVLTGVNRNWLPPFLIILLVLAAFQLVSAWIRAVYAYKINGKLGIVGSTSFFWKVDQIFEFLLTHA